MSTKIDKSTPILTGPNFVEWKVSITTYLRTKGLFKLVTGEESPPKLAQSAEIELAIENLASAELMVEAAEDGPPAALAAAQQAAAAATAALEAVQAAPLTPEQWVAAKTRMKEHEKELLEFGKRDDRAIGHIQQHIDSTHNNIVANCTTAKTMWTTLCARYELKQAENIIHLQGRLTKSTIGKDETMISYIGRLHSMRNQLEIRGVRVEDIQLVALLLDAARDRYEALIANFEFGNEMPDLVQLEEKLLNVEQLTRDRNERKGLTTDTDDNVLYASSNKSQGRWNGRGGSGGRGGSRPNRGRDGNSKSSDRRSQDKSGNGKGERDATDKRDKKCFNCGKKGHFARDCWAKKKEEEEEDSFVAATFSVLDRFMLDSGASNHMTSRLDWLEDLTDISPVTIRIGDGTALYGTKSGTVRMIATVDGTERPLKITNVLYVPKISRNLLSFGQLEDKGLLIKPVNREIHISRDGRTLATAQRHRRIYVLNAVHRTSTLSDNGTANTATTSVNDSTKLWHQ